MTLFLIGKDLVLEGSRLKTFVGEEMLLTTWDGAKCRIPSINSSSQKSKYVHHRDRRFSENSGMARKPVKTGKLTIFLNCFSKAPQIYFKQHVPIVLSKKY